MKPITDYEKQDLIQRLLIKIVTCSRGRSAGVGYHIKKLCGRDKEIAKSLTSEDFQHRMD